MKGAGGGRSGEINFLLYIESRDWVRAGSSDAVKLKVRSQTADLVCALLTCGRRLCLRPGGFHAPTPMCTSPAWTARPPRLPGRNLRGPAQVAVKISSTPVPEPPVYLRVRSLQAQASCVPAAGHPFQLVSPRIRATSPVLHRKDPTLFQPRTSLLKPRTVEKS